MTTNLRKILGRGTALAVPGASDALSARLIEAHGYECVYIGSYATAASRFGITGHGAFVVGIASRAGAHHHQSRAHPRNCRRREWIRSAKNRCHVRGRRRRIRAAVAARRNPDFIIAARSDAFWVHVLYYAFSITRQFAALQRALADGKLASDSQPLEDFLGYKDAGRKHE